MAVSAAHSLSGMAGDTLHALQSQEQLNSSNSPVMWPDQSSCELKHSTIFCFTCSAGFSKMMCNVSEFGGDGRKRTAPSFTSLYKNKDVVLN